jgi:flavorubredoxin
MKFIFCTGPKGGGNRDLSLEVRARLINLGYKVVLEKIKKDLLKNVSKLNYIFGDVLDYTIVRFSESDPKETLEELVALYPDAIFLFSDRAQVEIRKHKVEKKKYNLIVDTEVQVSGINDFMESHAMSWIDSHVPSFDDNLNLLKHDSITRKIAMLGSFNLG